MCIRDRCKALIENGYQIIGLDNISDYYSVELKNNRLKELKRIGSKHKNLFRFKQLNILDKVKISELFERESFSQVNPSCCSSRRSLFDR